MSMLLVMVAMSELVSKVADFVEDDEKLLFIESERVKLS